MLNPAPAEASQFLLGGVFALACRWAKRNPSEFLRYCLFPVGGIHVERWPQLILRTVRVCGILGFFIFFSLMFDAAFPGSVQSPTPAVLYSKFALKVLVTLFATWGSSEEKYERSPSVAKSWSSRPQTALRSTATTPADASGQVRYSDVEAPPTPRRSSFLTAPDEKVVQSRRAYALSAVVLGLGWAAFCFVLGAKLLAYFFLVGYGLVVVLRMAALKKAPAVMCPFCSEPIERFNLELRRGEPLRCQHCSEYSKFVLGRLIALDPGGPDAIAAKPFFRSPAFENAIWPNGCVLCGELPTRFDDATDERFQMRRLATPGAAFVVPHPAVLITGIPYCDRHRDAVLPVAPKEMFDWPWKYFPGYAEKFAEKRTAFLLWRSLAMMRRYLTANRLGQCEVSTGYRAPNLFQKIVTAPFSSAKPGTPNPRNAPK